MPLMGYTYVQNLLSTQKNLSAAGRGCGGWPLPEAYFIPFKGLTHVQNLLPDAGPPASCVPPHLLAYGEYRRLSRTLCRDRM